MRRVTSASVAHFLDKELAVVDRTGRQMKNLKPAASELDLRPGQTAERVSESLIKRVIEHASRHERMLATRTNLQSVRGLAAPRVPAAHLSERVFSLRRR